MYLYSLLLMHILWFFTLCLYAIMQLFLTCSCLPRFSISAKFSKITNGLPWIVLSSIKALPEKLQREGLRKIFLSHPAIKRMTTFVWYIPFKKFLSINQWRPMAKFNLLGYLTAFCKYGLNKHLLLLDCQSKLNYREQSDQLWKKTK